MRSIQERLDPEILPVLSRRLLEQMATEEMPTTLKMGVDVDVEIEMMVTPERQEFGRILKEEGLKAALAWREARFG